LNVAPVSSILSVEGTALNFVERFLQAHLNVNVDRSMWLDLLHGESGQDTMEYVLVAALVALGSVAVMKSFATTVSASVNTVNSGLTSDI
jgi:pilus assembly protein Flp/PilA